MTSSMSSFSSCEQDPYYFRLKSARNAVRTDLIKRKQLICMRLIQFLAVYDKTCEDYHGK